MNATMEPTRLEVEASDLAKKVYDQFGIVTLSCDCGGHELVVDGDAIGNDASIRQIADLIEHAKFDHVSPRNVIATKPVIVLETER